MARVNTTACIVYVDGAEFDGVFIVDGLGIMWDGVYNSEIIRVVQESLRAGKMVAAVGHGVAALCNVTDDRGNFIVAGKQVHVLDQSKHTFVWALQYARTIPVTLGLAVYFHHAAVHLERKLTMC